MNILIPDKWLREYITTNATPQEFAKAMSLTSVSIERMHEVEGDIVYDIEITTNRPELMSVRGMAQEASAVLPEAGFTATFHPKQHDTPSKTVTKNDYLTITNDPKLVKRILAVVMDVTLKPSPKVIQDRLKQTDIRTLNNLVDVTNYIMREVGHPVHVFDYDRLGSTVVIRESKKDESITTLDGKTYKTLGGDIVADNGTGEIVDLLGVMGTENSAVTANTKRVVLFLDNNDKHRIRKTSMGLGIRTEAAVINEKGIDPELMMPTFLRGVELLKEIADAKIVGEIIDIYPEKAKEKKVSVSFEKINSVIGIEIPQTTAVSILKNLGFGVTHTDKELTAIVPTDRLDDIDIQEDLIEEVARVYGYHKIPSTLPIFTQQAFYHQDNDPFYWISKVKNAMKYWGFNETYTYSMVGEELFEGPIDTAIKLKNPLTEDRAYLRNSLTPSLLEVARINNSASSFRLFEIANVYINKKNSLPHEKLNFVFLIKNERVSFREGKGILEGVLQLLGIDGATYTKDTTLISGAKVMLSRKQIGTIEIEDDELVAEVDFSELLEKTNSKVKYVEPSKYPTATEDVRIETPSAHTYEVVSTAIKDVSDLIQTVELLDVYGNKKTFRIIYHNKTRNLTAEDLTKLREKVNAVLVKKFKAKIG